MLSFSENNMKFIRLVTKLTLSSLIHSFTEIKHITVKLVYSRRSSDVTSVNQTVIDDIKGC